MTIMRSLAGYLTLQSTMRGCNGDLTTLGIAGEDFLVKTTDHEVLVRQRISGRGTVYAKVQGGHVVGAQ